MLPMSSSNHYTHMESSWKTYYDAKEILRQTEKRLRDTRECHPHIHLGSYRDNNDVSAQSSTSSYLLHGDTTPIHAGNRSMFNDERSSNAKHQLLDSEALQTIRRKINKQKLAAERRAEHLFHSQSDAGCVFGTYPHSSYSTSASLQNLHYTPHRQQRSSPPKIQATYSSHLPQSQSFPSELDNILGHSTNSKLPHRDNSLEDSSTIRNTSKILPNNYSLSHNRTTQQRCVSASAGFPSKYHDHSSFNYLSSTDNQRFKSIRPTESAHATTGSTSKTNISWRVDPIVAKELPDVSQYDKSLKKKTTEIISKPTKSYFEDTSNRIPATNEKNLKTKRDTNAIKSSNPSIDKSLLKPIAKPKSDDEKKKRIRDEQERIPKEKLKTRNDIIKDNSRHNLPPSSSSLSANRTSAFTQVVTPKDITQQTRQRLIRLLGSPTHNNVPESSLVERSFSSTSSSSLSSSSISSSNDSVIEVQQTKRNTQSTNRSRSEPPHSNVSNTNNVQRHQNIVRWAQDLTRDCDVVENRFRNLQSTVNQTNESTMPPYERLQYDEGNIRYTTPRSAGRSNSHNVTDYSGLPIPIVNENRDPLSERRLYRDRAAAKIQAAYRGYSVRKSLSSTNQKQDHLHNEFNIRPIPCREPSLINGDTHMMEHNFPIESAMGRHYENSSISDHHQQITRKPTASPLHTDNITNVPISSLSTPNNKYRATLIDINFSLGVPNDDSSISTTPVPSPEPHAPTQINRRRSLSPPSHPQMSPDNGRPVNHLVQRQPEENTKPIDRPKSSSQIQNNTSLQQQSMRKSPVRQPSTSSTQKRHSPSPQEQNQLYTTSNINSRHRTTHASSPPTSSSESILTAREKRIRQKFNSDVELQAYEKRLKDIEKKIRQLVKRAFEIFDEKRSISSSPTITHSNATDSSHNRSKSSNQPLNESNLSKEPNIKDSDTSSISNRRHSDAPTSDASDLERRVNAYREQLKAKKAELERLKQRKNKEILRRQEDELKKQIESCDNEIRTLRSPSIQQEQTVPIPFVNSSNSTAEKTKSNSSISSKSIKQTSSPKHNLEHFLETRPVETPGDDRDTQFDAQSISTTNDIHVESDIESDIPQPNITNQDKLVSNLISNIPIISNNNEDTKSSSSTISNKSHKSLSTQISKSPSPPPISSNEPPNLLILPSATGFDLTVTKEAQSSLKNLNLFSNISSSDDNSDRTPSGFVVAEKPAELLISQLPKPISSPPILTEYARSPSPQASESSISLPTPPPPPPESYRSLSPPTQEQTQSVTSESVEFPPPPQQVKSPSPSISEPLESPKSAQIQIDTENILKPEISYVTKEEKESNARSINNEYDEDFSENSRSPVQTPMGAPIDELENESIKEELEKKSSRKNSDRSVTSKSSEDEQSEILVLGRKSAENTPRKQEEIPPSKHEPLYQPILPSVESVPLPVQNKFESDDTSHDISEVDSQTERTGNESNIDKLTDKLIRSFIDEAIDQSKQIENAKINTSIEKEPSESISDDETTDDDPNRATGQNHDEDEENLLEALSNQLDLLKDSKTPVNGTPESEVFDIDLSRLEDKTADEPRIESPRKTIVNEPTNPVVSHTSSQVIQLCNEAIKILFDQNDNFSKRSSINRKIPEYYLNYDALSTETEEVRQSRHAYNRMIFDLCVELLYEMYSSTVRKTKYPEWQKTKLISKRFYRLHQPKTRDEAERFIKQKVLEILNLSPRQIIYSKWRMPITQRHELEQFELVLDEELHRTEPQWTDYEDDCIRIKFSVADYIFHQLIDETLNECLHVVTKRLVLSSN